MPRSPGGASRPAIFGLPAALCLALTGCTAPVQLPAPAPSETTPTSVPSNLGDACGDGPPIEVKFGGPLLFCNAVEVKVTADDARLDDADGANSGTAYVEITLTLKNLGAKSWRGRTSTVEVYYGEARVPARILGESKVETDGGRLDNDTNVNLKVADMTGVTRVNGYKIPIDARYDIRVEVRLSDEMGEVVIFRGSTT